MQLRQREDAMDAVQDAMLRLVKHYRDKPATEWAPLFWGILRRRIIDLQRRRKVRSIVVNWLGGGRTTMATSCRCGSRPIRARIRSTRLHDVQSYADMAAAVQKLPQRQREAFMLRMLEGLDVSRNRASHGLLRGQRKNPSVARHASAARLNWRIGDELVRQQPA